MNKQINQSFLRATAFTSILVGAVGSLYFMFNVGRENKSIILIGLFTAWVSSPFVGVIMANKIFDRWKISARASLYWLMLVLAICSLVAYSGVLTPRQTKPAFIFLIFPLISWFLIVTVLLIAKKISSKSNDNNQT